MKEKIVVVSLLLIIFNLLACSNEKITSKEISFSELSTEVGEQEYKIAEEMYDLDGELVEIEGYFSTLTPLKREFFFLTGTPGVACPYCDDGTEEVNFFTLIQVYFPEDEGFSFSRDKQRVVGRFEVGEEKDEFGIKSKFRLQAKIIEDAD